MDCFFSLDCVKCVQFLCIDFNVLMPYFIFLHRLPFTFQSFPDAFFNICV